MSGGAAGVKLGFFGAGAWGTALASASAAARNDVVLWARSERQCATLRAERVNRRYLDGVTLPAGLAITSDFDAALAHARGGLAIVATPMAALAEMLGRIVQAGGEAPAVLWLCKGLEFGSARLGHEVAQAVAPALRVGVISGPSFAIEVARGQPTALLVASADPASCEATVAALHGESLRIYTSDDAIGVEVGGAVKNVMAIATGIADGLGLGLNARAALITRGLAETTRFGLALGARAETFTGLSGLGDLVLTATGDLSRNRQVGLMLARGLALPESLGRLGHVAEGVLCASAVHERALAHGVEMPITHAVVQVLQGRTTPAQALAQLMGRSARAEA